jgi:mannosyltransferase OCH1-like enzyme
MIPKTIHIIWMQGVSGMPTQYLNNCQSWEKKHRSWIVQVWSEKTLPKLQNSWALDIKDPVIQSDVIRFELVRQFGGVYVDCDMFCLQPIDALVTKLDAFISKRSRDVLASSSFGAAKEHPWLVDLINEIGKRKDTLTHPGEIRGPLERATRRHPEVVRLENTLFELAEAKPQSYATHNKSGAWRDKFKEKLNQKRRRPDTRKPWPRQQDT